jgi:hypothetical protein
MNQRIKNKDDTIHTSSPLSATSRIFNAVASAANKRSFATADSYSSMSLELSSTVVAVVAGVGTEVSVVVGPGVACLLERFLERFLLDRRLLVRSELTGADLLTGSDAATSGSEVATFCSAGAGLVLVRLVLERLVLERLVLDRLVLERLVLERLVLGSTSLHEIRNL